MAKSLDRLGQLDQRVANDPVLHPMGVKVVGPVLTVFMTVFAIYVAIHNGHAVRQVLMMHNLGNVRWPLARVVVGFAAVVVSMWYRVVTGLLRLRSSQRSQIGG